MTVIVLQLYQIVMLAKENVFIVIMIANARFTETKSVEVVEGALKVCIGFEFLTQITPTIISLYYGWIESDEKL